MCNDTELLRRYVEESSESSFAELVKEHVNLVYSAAVRETNADTGLAEDISQAVFTELARKAHRLLDHPSLAGWLYTTVRHVASNVRRSEQRRRHREEEVMNELLSENSPDQTWKQLRPVLDDALHELNEADRSALVLRFLEDRSLREIAAALRLNENAARMRVERALDKLRGLLARRGITSTASGLTAAFAVGAITPAPAALAATIAGTALASGVAAGSTALTLTKIMSMAKVKLSLIGALVFTGVALPVWQQTRLQRAESENAQLRAQEAELTALREEAERLRKVEDNQAELERLRQWQARTEPELLRLRGMSGVARRANAEAVELRTQLERQAKDGGSNRTAGPMTELMKNAMEQQVLGKLARMTASLSLTPEQAQAAREILMRQADAASVGIQQVFSGKFDKEELARLGKEGGNPDEQIKALLTPEQKAHYKDYQQEEAAHNARLAANNELLQMQSSLGLTAEQQDQVFGALYELTFSQLNGAASPTATTPAEQLQWVSDQKAKALEPLLTPAQMESFRQQQNVQMKFMKDILGKMDSSNSKK